MTAKIQAKKVQLRLTELSFIRTVEEIEDGPKVRTLVVDREVVQKMVAWAEALKWRNPNRSVVVKQIPRAAVSKLVDVLTEALATPAAPSTSRSQMRADVPAQMHAYFEVPANRRQLLKTLELLQLGGELDIEEVRA